MALAIIERPLDVYRPDERHESVAAIELGRIDELVDEGRTLFVSDIDGTAGINGSFEIDEDTKAVYQRITEKGATLVLWTNITGKTDDELTRMQWFAHTLGAKFVTFKDAVDEGKPSPAKIHAIIELINTEKSQEEQKITTANTVMMGDKLTADIPAGNYARDTDPTIAGVHTIWTKRLGAANTDVSGDRWLRRPIEKLIWWGLGRKSRMEREQAPGNIQQIKNVGGLALNGSKVESQGLKNAETYNRAKLETREFKSIPGILEENSLIANVGNGPILKISAEKFETLPPPRTEPIHIAMRGLKNSLVMRRIEAHAAEHGKRDADILTLARLYSVPLVLGSIVMRRFGIAPDLFIASSLGLFVGSSITDVVDGYLARIYFKHHPEVKRDLEEKLEAKKTEAKLQAEKTVETDELIEKNNTFKSKYDKTIQSLKNNLSWENIKNDPTWGAEWDPKADKWLCYAAGLGLMFVHPLLISPIILSIGRDIYRDKIQKPRLKEQGFSNIDLSATRSSKNSTAILMLANVVCLTNPSPTKMFAAQIIAAEGKYYSLYGSVKVWKLRKAFREAAAEKRKIMTEIYNERNTNATS